MQTLRLFTEVARRHSFSQAARRYGITQSAASQCIGQLEKRLGVTLLNRSVRPLALTEAGEAFLAGCEDLLHRYDQLEREVAGMEAEPTGTVRVAAIYSAGIDLLEQVRESFEREHPKIRIEIDYDQPGRVHQSVREQEAEIGLLSYPRRWKQVGVIPLRDEPMAAVCSPVHPLAGRTRVHAGELTPHEMVTFDRDLPVGRRIRQYLREQGATPTIAHSFDNIDTIKNAARVTGRFSILPRRTASLEASRGELAVVDLVPALVRPIGMIHRHGRGRQGPHFSPPTRQFVNYLLKQAGPGSETASPAQQAMAP